MDNKNNMNDIIKKINTINDLIINNIESSGFQKEFELEQKERCYNKYYMWLDCAVLVQKNFNFIFDILKENDFYFNLCGTIKESFEKGDRENIGFKKSYESMNVSFQEVKEKRFISGGLWGINLKTSKGLELLKLNKKYLDIGTPFFSPCADLAVMMGILHILYPDSDPPSFPNPIGNYFYYYTNH